MSVAHGGQIIVSTATEELLRDALPEKYGFVDLGEHRLRDLGRPEHLFQVAHPDLRRELRRSARWTHPRTTTCPRLSIRSSGVEPSSPMCSPRSGTAGLSP